MPLVKPAWLTLIIFAFQQIWNREGLEYIYSEPLKTLPTMLKQISSGGMARAGAGRRCRGDFAAAAHRYIRYLAITYCGDDVAFRNQVEGDSHA